MKNSCILKDKCILQVASIKLHVTNFLKHDLLHLMAILLVLLLAGLLWLVGTNQPLLFLAHRLDGLLLALVTNLPGLLLAVLGVAVLLGFLGTSLHFKLADLLRLEMTVLFLYREGEDIGELFTIPVHISLASFHLNLNMNNKSMTDLTRY